VQEGTTIQLVLSKQLLVLATIMLLAAPAWAQAGHADDVRAAALVRDIDAVIAGLNQPVRPNPIRRPS
jgi:hypothetical protein